MPPAKPSSMPRRLASLPVALLAVSTGFAVALSFAIASSGCGGSRATELDSGQPGAPPDAGGCHCDEASGVCTAHAPEGGAASLSALRVTVAGEAGLVPTFSPAVHDYAVACGPGSNAVTVTLAPRAGATASLSIESPGGSTVAAKSGTLSVHEGQAIVAHVAAGSESDEYWVRCLPHDFPAMRWVSHANGCQ